MMMPWQSLARLLLLLLLLFVCEGETLRALREDEASIFRHMFQQEGCVEVNTTEDQESHRAQGPPQMTSERWPGGITLQDMVQRGEGTDAGTHATGVRLKPGCGCETKMCPKLPKSINDYIQKATSTCIKFKFPLWNIASVTVAFGGSFIYAGKAAEPGWKKIEGQIEIAGAIHHGVISHTTSYVGTLAAESTNAPSFENLLRAPIEQMFRPDILRFKDDPAELENLIKTTDDEMVKLDPIYNPNNPEERTDYALDLADSLQTLLTSLGNKIKCIAREVSSPLRALANRLQDPSVGLKIGSLSQGDGGWSKLHDHAVHDVVQEILKWRGLYPVAKFDVEKLKAPAWDIGHTWDKTKVGYELLQILFEAQEYSTTLMAKQLAKATIQTLIDPEWDPEAGELHDYQFDCNEAPPRSEIQLEPCATDGSSDAWSCYRPLHDGRLIMGAASTVTIPGKMLCELLSGWRRNNGKQEGLADQNVARFMAEGRAGDYKKLTTDPVDDLAWWKWPMPPDSKQNKPVMPYVAVVVMSSLFHQLKFHHFASILHGKLDDHDYFINDTLTDRLKNTWENWNAPVLVGEQLEKLEGFLRLIEVLTIPGAAEQKVRRSTQVMFETHWDDTSKKREWLKDLCASRRIEAKQRCADEAIEGWLFDFKSRKTQKESMKEAIEAQANLAGLMETGTRSHSQEPLDLVFSFTHTAATAQSSMGSSSQICGGAKKKFNFAHTWMYMQRLKEEVHPAGDRDYLKVKPLTDLVKMTVKQGSSSLLGATFGGTLAYVDLPQAEFKKFTAAMGQDFLKKNGVNGRNSYVTIKLPFFDGFDAANVLSTAMEFAPAMLKGMLDMAQNTQQETADEDESGYTSEGAMVERLNVRQVLTDIARWQNASGLAFVAGDMLQDELGAKFLEAGVELSIKMRIDRDPKKPLSFAAYLTGSSGVTVEPPAILDAFLGSFVPVIPSIEISRKTQIDLSGLFMQKQCVERAGKLVGRED